MGISVAVISTSRKCIPVAPIAVMVSFFGALRLFLDGIGQFRVLELKVDSDGMQRDMVTR